MAEYSENDFILSLDNYLPDNATEQISPKDVRDSFINLVDSSHRFLEAHNVKALNIESAELRQTRVGELSLGNVDLSYETGEDNTAVGYSSMNGNVYGNRNTAVGSYTLSCNLDGVCNTAVGYGSIIGVIEGTGNVGLGCKTLHNLRAGSYNLAIGHGAGYYVNDIDSYQFYLGAHPEVSGSCCMDGSGTPLMRGDLEELKLAIGTNELHNYGTLQVSGDASPSVTRVFGLGNDNRAWRSLNGQLVFPNADRIESKSDIIPCYDGLNLGTPELRWDGFFRDVQIYGDLTVNGDTVCPSGSGLQRFAEGFFIEDVEAPSSFCSPTSGRFTEKRICDGVCEDGPTYYAINRDPNLTIYNGTYAQFAKHGTEWRPIWVSCAPTDPYVAPTTTTTSGPTTTTTSAPTTTCEPTTTTTTEPTTTTTLEPTTTTTLEPTTTTTLEPTTTTTTEPTTTTTTSPTTTTTITPFGAAGCDSIEDFPSAADVNFAAPYSSPVSAAYPLFDSGVKSLFISSTFQGDAYSPSMDLYQSLLDIDSAYRHLDFGTDDSFGCCGGVALPDASGWGNGYMALLTDGQQIPSEATNVEEITLSNFKILVDSLDYTTWPDNRYLVDNDTSSGILLLGYHDRCGSMTELSGVVAASADYMYDFMRCNGLIWIKGAHTDSCLDIDNMNFILEKLLCESRFSDETNIKLQGNSTIQHEQDKAYFNDNFSLGSVDTEISGGCKICVPDASGFYLYNASLNEPQDLYGKGQDYSIHLGDQNRSPELIGNVVNPIYIHSGDISPTDSSDVMGQFYSSGVFTFVHELTFASGVQDFINGVFGPCKAWNSWACCGAPDVPVGCEPNQFGQTLCGCAESRLAGRSQSDIDNLPDGCAKTDIQSAFDYIADNCPCTTTTTAPPTTTTTTGPPTNTCQYTYNSGGGGWINSAGGPCTVGSCGCPTFTQSELNTIWNNIAGSPSLSDGDILNTIQDCNTCAHTYSSHTDN